MMASSPGQASKLLADHFFVRACAKCAPKSIGTLLTTGTDACLVIEHDTRSGTSRFDRISDEPDCSVAHQNMRSTLVAEQLAVVLEFKEERLHNAPVQAFALGGSKVWNRTWTNQSDQKLSAQLTSIRNGKATFLQGKKRLRVPFEELAIKDQEYVVEILKGGPPLSNLSYVLVGGANDSKVRSRIVDAMDFAVKVYNEFGRVEDVVLRVDYHPGVPTAEGNINGSIKFGGQIGRRVALHEICHCMGVGQHHRWGELMQGGRWTGPEATAQLREFDGPEAVLKGDRNHFWPYGLNDDNESSPENDRRHVLMVMALRRDMGL